MFKHTLMENCKGDGVSLPVVPSERSKATHQNTGNSTKQEKTLFVVRVVHHENGLPPLRLVECLSLEIFGTQLESALSSLQELTLL